MKWIKKGLIFKANGEYGWINSHAQIPKVLVKEECLRIYFAPRPKPGESCIAMMDLDINNPSKIIHLYEKPVLEHGEEGQFDEHGVMPNWVDEIDGKVYLTYVGWSRRDSIPYSNWTGIACSEDGGLSFKKMFQGPILDRTPYETLSGTGLMYIKENGIYYAFYATGTKWYKRDQRWDSAYEIVSAKSNDLIYLYDRSGVPILPTRIDNEANTVPTVIKIDNIYHMWFCYRGTDDYRDGKSSYSIGYAWSKDLENWHREDGNSGIEKDGDGFDSKMMAYPCVVKVRDKYLMFYNGNGFGQSGFGYAELDLSEGDNAKTGIDVLDSR